MKSWAMGRKLFLGIGALMALIAVSGGLALYSLASIQGNMEKAAGIQTRRIALAGLIGSNAGEAWGSEQGVVVSTFIKDRKNVDSYWEQEKSSLKVISDSAAELKPLLVLEASKVSIATIQADLMAWQKGAEQVYSLCDDGQPAEAQAASRDITKPHYKEIVKLGEEIRAANVKMMEDARDDGAKQYASVRMVLIGVVLLAMAVGVIVFWVVRGVVSTLRNTVTELSNSGEQVAAASSQIAGTSQSLSQGSSEEAASLEEISASMEEMTAMTKRNGENSSEATVMMAETVSQIGHSNQALQDMVASMGAIKVSSEKVAKIIKTIDEIAFQTNILALNAAVEAARAGEAGMGFAVVADEVRNLAQRSAVAAKDTAVLIEEAIANSNQGAQKLEQVAASIRAITDSAGKVKGLVDEVGEASKQQTQGINQVATAVTQVSTVTQTAAASAEETAAASEELSAQSQSVQDLVNELRALVEGGSGQNHQRPRMTATKMAPKMAHQSKPKTGVASRKASSEEAFPMETTGTGSFRSF